MFYIIKVGAEPDKRFLTYSGDFSCWSNARTFFGLEKAEKMADKMKTLAVKVESFYGFYRQP